MRCYTKGVLMRKLKDTLEDALEAFFQGDGILLEAVRFAISGGGKRFRPLLALLVAKMLKVPEEKVIKPACALEMVHTFSLIHDDLPCIDDDDVRRGRPSLHRAFPESIAVLAGDFLLNYAFEIVHDAKLVRILSQATREMIEGQVLDVQGGELSFDALCVLHRKKTGALIRAAVDFGAILGGGSDRERAHLLRFGDALGLAFQIRDDILDRNGDDHTKNFVGVLGLEEAKNRFAHYKNQASAFLEVFGDRAAILLEFCFANTLAIEYN